MTIVHRGERPLEAFDDDLVDLLVRRTRELGIRVELGTEARGLQPAGDGVVVFGTRAAREVRFEADLAVHAAGRVAEIADLDLDVAGIRH